MQYAQRFPGAGPSDIIGITQTAWTISSFILTAAGGKSSSVSGDVLWLTFCLTVAIALLAAITQIGDV
jgi:hypothetical protein